MYSFKNLCLEPKNAWINEVAFLQYDKNILETCNLGRLQYVL